MIQSFKHSQIYEFLEEFFKVGLSEELLIQLALLGGCIGIGWVVARRLRPALKHGLDEARWKFGSEGVARVLFPTLSWLLIAVARASWPEAGPHSLLAVMGNLVGAWAVVRVTVHLIQEVFFQSGSLKRFERWIATILWIGVAMQIVGLMSIIRSALNSVNLDVGQSEISLLKIVDGMISVGLTLLIAMWLGRVFERRVMGADSLDMSLRVVVTKIVRTVLAVMAVLVALPLVGIDLTVLSVFGGALGVGLGFGLQKIANNYVSGFIILLDRSIRIGDLVTIENRNGMITGITARYVVLRLGDGTDAIIPNETLVSSTVLNLSYADRKFRVAIPLTIAHGSDIDMVVALLLEICKNRKRVLPNPEPMVLVRNLGETGIELEVGVWIEDPENGAAPLRSEINLEILRIFRKHGIVIPAPRRDVVVNDVRKLTLEESVS